jgi:mono/diheme cytochrome c family protein
VQQNEQPEEDPMARRKLAQAALSAAFLAISLQAGAAFDAAGYYQMRCATCHGVEGQGTKGVAMPATGPALKANPFVVNGSPAAIRNVIRKGRTGPQRLYDDTFPNMPGFGAEAVPDVDGLVAYLKGDLQK